MNIIFTILLIASSITMCMTSPDNVLSSMVSGAKNGLILCFTLFAIYTICMSILDIASQLKVDKKIGKLLYPLSSKLFKGEDESTLDIISMNFATNLLGMGGAATPLGIDAMARLSKGKSVAPKNAILFLVINATSIQLLPTTVIAMMGSFGATNPSCIIVPSLIATSIATLVGVILCKVLCHD